MYRHPCSIVKGTNHHFSSWQRIRGECKLENVNQLLLRGSQHEQETIHSSPLLEAVANLRAKAPQTQPPSSWVACICLWTKCRMLEGEAKTNATSKNSLIIYLEPMPWLRYEPGIRAFVEQPRNTMTGRSCWPIYVTGSFLYHWALYLNVQKTKVRLFLLQLSMKNEVLCSSGTYYVSITFL